MTNTEIAAIFKALSDENRIKILTMLIEGERCACHLLEELQVTQPTLSHHMKMLCDVGLVSSRKDGKWMHYSINKAEVKKVLTYFNSLNSAEETYCECC